MMYPVLVYAEAADRSPMVGGDGSAAAFPLRAYHCITPQSPLVYVNKSKALVIGEDYHVVITFNIHVHKMVHMTGGK
jgi:hypothetical protein